MEKPSLTGYKEFISTYNSLLTQADNLESDVLDKRDEIEEDASMSKEDKHTWKVYLNKVMRSRTSETRWPTMNTAKIRTNSMKKKRNRSNKWQCLK